MNETAAPTLADALFDAVHDRKPAVDGAHPALRELGESIGADGVELWMYLDDGHLVRTAMWANEPSSVRPDHNWKIDATSPMWPVLNDASPIMYANLSEPGASLDRACGAPINGDLRCEGILLAWPLEWTEYSESDCDAFLDLSEMISDVCRSGSASIEETGRQRFEQMIATANAMLLDRHSGDPDERLVDAMTMIGTGLDVNHLALFRVEEGEIRSKAG